MKPWKPSSNSKPSNSNVSSKPHSTIVSTSSSKPATAKNTTNSERKAAHGEDGKERPSHTLNSPPSRDQKTLSGKETHSSPSIDLKISEGISEAESLAAVESDPTKSVHEQEKNMGFNEAYAEKEKCNMSEKIKLLDDNITVGGRKDLMTGWEKDRDLEINSEGGSKTENLNSCSLAGREVASPETLCDQQMEGKDSRRPGGSLDMLITEHILHSEQEGFLFPKGEQLVLEGSSDCSSKVAKSREEEFYKTSQTNGGEKSRILNTIHIPLESASVKSSSDKIVHHAISTLPSDKPTDLQEVLMATEELLHKDHPNKDSSSSDSSSWPGSFVKLRSLCWCRGFLLSSIAVPTVCIIWFIWTATYLDESFYLPPT